METPGFGLRVGLSIIVVFGWLIFSILWLLFYAGTLNIYQNLAVIFVAILVGIAILAASWASWGVKYGWKYKKEWGQMEKSAHDYKCNMKEHGNWRGAGGAVYGMGFIGALVYYLTTAPNFWAALLGVVKAIFWPAFLVYGALKLIGG